MATPLHIELTPTASAPWTALGGIALGRAPADHRTPVLYGLIDRAGEVIARLDVYGDPESHSYFSAEAVSWADRIVLGFGWAVYIVRVEIGEVETIPLPCHFQSFRPMSGSLLVLSGNGITRVDPPGVVAWENDALGVDGVEVESISDGWIHGRGDWDPPGGWRPFRVAVGSGELAPDRHDVA